MALRKIKIRPRQYVRFVCCHAGMLIIAKNTVIDPANDTVVTESPFVSPGFSCPQLAYRRQERKLADSATVPGASATHNSSTQKENQHRSSATRSSKRLHTSHAKSRVKVSSTKSGISAEEGVSKYVAVAQSSEGGDARNGRALRSLTGRRQDDGDVSRVPKVEAVEDREEGTPPECQQS